MREGGSEHRPKLEGSVSFRISEGPFTASWGEDETEIRTTVDDLGFGDSGGRVRLNVGASMDPKLGSGTGLEIWIDQREFEKLLLAADEQWEGVECSVDTGNDRSCDVDDSR